MSEADDPGRKGRHKVFPIIVAVVAFLPSIGFLALSVLIGDLMEGELQPEYWELFGLPIVAVMLFATLVAPEAIVRDRRDGMLRLYLSTPLTAPTYLAAKFVAVMTSMAIVVAGPALLYLAANTIQGLGPDGFANWLEVAAKLLRQMGTAPAARQREGRRPCLRRETLDPNAQQLTRARNRLLP